MRLADRKYHQLSSSLTSFGYSQSMCTQAFAHQIFSVLLITGWVFCLYVQQSHAEVITDGTVGATQNLGGPNFVIPQTLGSTRGTNLFHSFQNFNIANTESATFTGANSLQNVISRVTGGQSSSINGVLRSQVGQAAFYFINPTGVVFGADAVVDVPGDFHVSTASELRFSDGTVFSTVQPDVSALSMASPAEFGFLSDQSSAIRVEQSNLMFATGTTTSLSGGQIVIDSGVLVNKGGEIRLTGVGSSGTTLSINTERNADSLGSVAIINSTINASGNGAGRIDIASGLTLIRNSRIAANNTGSDSVGPLSGVAMNFSSLLLDNSTVQSSALSDGDAGDVDISASAIAILNGTRISSSTIGSGNAGTINVEVDDMIIDRLSSTNNVTGITSNVEASASGKAGKVTVRADYLTIDGRSGNDNRSNGFLTGIVSNANMNSSGNAGTVDVIVTGKLEIFSEGQIGSSIFEGASGNAGTVNVETGRMTIDGRISEFGTGIFSNANVGSRGHAGSVDVDVTETLELFSEGQISSSIFERTSGNAGTVSVRAGDVTIDRQSGTSGTGIFSNANPNSIGNAGKITVQARNLIIDGRSIDFATGIFSIARRGSSGNAGRVDVTVTEVLNIFRSGQISSSISEGIAGTSGDAGVITVQARNLTIDGQSNEDGQSSGLVTGIVSNANMNSLGNAGTVDVMVTEKLEIFSEGQISSSIFEGASGDAGTVTVRADDITIDRQSGTSGTGIFSNANPNSIGNAGNITVQARNLSIDGQSIDFATGIFSNVRSDSSGHAGSVEVEVTEALNIFDAGQISSSIFEGTTGDAGAINIQAGNLTIDRQSGNSGTGIFTDANPNSLGDAGNIIVQVRNLTINGRFNDDGQSNGIATGIFSNARRNSSGNAGNIALNAGSLLISNGGLLSIESEPSVIPETLATIEPARIDITVDNVTLEDSTISTQSSGNVPAGSISVMAANRMLLDLSSITSEANNADGGEIIVSGGSAILQDSQITTSVLGQGDGGNIALDFKNLVLDTGFIQANTSGSGSQGGDITINVDALIASGNVLFSGGNRRFAFAAGSGNNVIQAVAPDGVNGAIDISSPELNIKGDLAGLTSDLTDVNTLVRDPCSIAGTQQSVLITGRRGGLPETAQDALAVPLNRNRLQQIMSDPDISGEDREPHQSDVLLDGENNRSALAFAAVERGCIN